MSASQQARNKQLNKIIDQLEDQIDRLQAERNEFQQSAVDALGKVEDLQDKILQLDAENSRLLHLMQEAWTSGWQTGRSGVHHSEIMPKWMKQKGLA